MICNDNEPVVKKLDQAVALHREDDMVVKESSQSGCNEHNHFLVGGMTWCYESTWTTDLITTSWYCM